MIKLKFVVVEHTKKKDWTGGDGIVGTVRLSPVTTGSDENKAFAAETPNGVVEFSQPLGSLLEELPIGAEVYVTVDNPAYQA